MQIVSYINRTIEYLFYSLFLLVPLVFAGNTSELFEFSKMWITFGITSVIVALWFSKMVLLRKIVFKRTIFDIFIFLFLLSHIISTIISLDSYISFWGYYSRWNGGLLSIITYILLYYAFVSNFFSNEEEKENENKSWFEKNPTATTVIKRSLIVSIVAGVLTSLWALPSHFGYDPTCLAFRGSFDVSCWTADFQPKLRVFSTLGQPNWLAGYLGLLLPISLAFLINRLRTVKSYVDPWMIFYGFAFLLYYLILLYTGSRSGMAASIFSLVLFGIIYIVLNRKDLWILKNKIIWAVIAGVFLISFFAQVRLPVVEKFSLNFVTNQVMNNDSSEQAESETTTESVDGAPAVTALAAGGSRSGEIRNIVWRGGLEAWKANPIFGTGVETYAFAYYKYRPIEHNMVSEWNFLYNKAHNEYLNYLVTTGSVGLITYLSFIFLYIFVVLFNFTNKKVKEIKYFGKLSSPDFVDNKDPLILSLLMAFVSMLIINFFGFSVVILNIFLFMIPLFSIILLGLVDQKKNNEDVKYISYPQWLSVAGLLCIALVLVFILVRFWIADTKYALGKGYNQQGYAENAYQYLLEATNMRQEPVFLDEQAVNKATLALALSQQPEAASGTAELIGQLAQEAIQTSDQLVQNHPNNVVFSKSRVRILYSLAQMDTRFFAPALEAIKQTAILAPTDASILYNLGVLYGQNGQVDEGIKVLERTIEYKPDYREARYALALFYNDKATDPESGALINPEMRQKAIDQINFILENLDPNFQQGIDSLKEWEG